MSSRPEGAPQLLLTPGPTPLHPEVSRAMTQPMIDHRGPEFTRLLESLTHKAEEFFGLREGGGGLLTLTCSGTGGLEAAVRAILHPEQTVLSISNGYFGNRLRTLAISTGADIVPLDFRWGKDADPDVVRKVLDKHPTEAVLLVHNETSTGVTNDLFELASIAKRHDCLVIVDGVSSVPGLPMYAASWNLDAVVASSQKGFGPPGISFVGFNQPLWTSIFREDSGGYLSLSQAKIFSEKGQTPWTPAIPIFYAVDKGLELLLEEGVEDVWRRHARLASLSRKLTEDLGLRLLGKSQIASNTVTAISMPVPKIDTTEFLRILREDENVVLAGGQGELAGGIVRVGNMGDVTEEDIQAAFMAIDRTLSHMGWSGKY